MERGAEKPRTTHYNAALPARRRATTHAPCRDQRESGSGQISVRFREQNQDRALVTRMVKNGAAKEFRSRSLCDGIGGLIKGEDAAVLASVFL